MKKILVVLCLLTAGMVFAEDCVNLRFVLSPEEAKAFDKAHPELENPSDYYFIDESLGYCSSSNSSSISQKAEKMLSLIMDKVINVLEEDNNSKEGE